LAYATGYKLSYSPMRPGWSATAPGAVKRRVDVVTVMGNGGVVITGTV
jgi:hypothetical protein